MPHVATYSFRGPTALRITKETDPVFGTVIALNVCRHLWKGGPDDLAGRPGHSRRPWRGIRGRDFETGTWSGNQLTVKTTHIKRGWIQRNGGYTSDQATVTDHYILMAITSRSSPSLTIPSTWKSRLFAAPTLF